MKHYEGYLRESGGLDTDIIEDFLSVHGERGQLTMRLLRRGSKFKGYLESEMGQYLLSFLTQKMDELLDKIIDLKAKDQDIHEYKVAREMFRHLAQQLHLYMDAETKIKEAYNAKRSDSNP